MAGLWIRVAANLGDRNVTWRLVEVLRAERGDLPSDILRAAASGYLIRLWGKIAEHTSDGVIAHLPDAQLEDWAGWAGSAGAFARWLRAEHLDQDTGTCREWAEYAGELQRHRQRDAERKAEYRDRQRREREAEEAARTAGEHAGDLTRPRAVDDTGPNVAGTPRQIALALTVAANKGMDDNPKIGDDRYNPIVAGRADGLALVDTLRSAGCDDFTYIRDCVYTLAKRYTPTKPGDQINSLRFFEQRLVAAWEKAVAKRQAAESTANDVTADITPAKRTGAKGATPAERAQRTGAGALAAANALAARKRA